MKIKSAVALTAITLLFAGCATTTPSDVSPGDGPAAGGDKTASKPKSSTAAKPKVASFKDKYTYPDGLEIEVTKINTKKISESAAVDDDKGKVGDPYTVLTVRVRNGTDATLDVIGSGKISYGPDGDEAPSVYDQGVDGGVDGKILAGKAKSGTWGYLIPKKYLDDVTYEFSADFEHDAAVFTGSVK